jgi:hypothetical protein
MNTILNDLGGAVSLRHCCHCCGEEENKVAKGNSVVVVDKARSGLEKNPFANTPFYKNLMLQSFFGP